MEVRTIELERTIFYNASNFYNVSLVVDRDSDEEFMIVGNFRELQEDIRYQIKGKFRENERYGEQFQVEILTKEKESTVAVFSEKLKEEFPLLTEKDRATLLQCVRQKEENIEFLEFMDHYRDILFTLPYKDDFRIDIYEMSHDVLSEHFFIYDLERFGFTPSEVDKLIVYTRENYMYQKELLYEYGSAQYIPFQKIDVFARQALKFPHTLFERRKYLIIAIITKYLNQTGNTYIDRKILQERIIQSERILKLEPFQLEEEDTALQLHRAYIALDEYRLTLPIFYAAESFIAQEVLERYYQESEDGIEERIARAFERIKQNRNFLLDEHQQKIVEQCLMHGISIITGGPGTGKTTLVQHLIELIYALHTEDDVLAIVAPTGRASRRLEEVTTYKARTIHSLLQYTADGSFQKNETNRLTCQYIIIDEFSMVDIFLFQALLKALKRDAKIIIVGDKNQLESVAPGKVLADLISFGKLPVFELMKTYRQKNKEIGILAQQLMNNKFIPKDVEGDHVRFLREDQQHIPDVIQKIYEHEYTTYSNTIFDIQLVYPKYKGSVGVHALNTYLQQHLHRLSGTTRTKAYKSKGRTFYLGDKVLMLENSSTDEVSNGDIGEVTHITSTFIEVDFGNSVVIYNDENSDALTLGYAITVHKAQGSESSVMIIVVDKEASFMMTKRLLYTAITRAIDRVYILGDLEQFAYYMERNYELPRSTFLKEQLLQMEEENKKTPYDFKEDLDE